MSKTLRSSQRTCAKPPATQPKCFRRFAAQWVMCTAPNPPFAALLMMQSSGHPPPAAYSRELGSGHFPGHHCHRAVGFDWRFIRATCPPMTVSPLAFSCPLNIAPVAAGAEAPRPKIGIGSPLFSSREVGNSHSVLIEHDGVRHAVRHTKPYTPVAVDLQEPREIGSARIAASAAKRLIANAFRDAA